MLLDEAFKKYCMSVDCAHSKFQKPRYFSTMWCSNKFNNPAFVSKVSFSLDTGLIVWAQ